MGLKFIWNVASADQSENSNNQLKIIFRKFRRELMSYKKKCSTQKLQITEKSTTFFYTFSHLSSKLPSKIEKTLFCFVFAGIIVWSWNLVKYTFTFSGPNQNWKKYWKIFEILICLRFSTLLPQNELN